MKELVLQYNGGSVWAKMDSTKKELVHCVSFEISGGESLALIGETGSGKTMIARSVLGVLPQNVQMSHASIFFCGHPLPSGRKLRGMLGRDIVYIPQNGHEFLNPSAKIRQHFYDSLKKADVPAKDRKQIACEKLGQVGFTAPEEIMGKYPFQLSGGMAQRVTIALALCSRAKLLIADEPTNGLDSDAKQQFLSLLNNLFPRAARLVITHDISVAAMCDRILVLCGGRMQEIGPACDVLKAPRHPYTKALLGALVENGMQETPALRESAGECPFYGRCSQGRAACLGGEIQIRKQDTREWWCNLA